MRADARVRAQQAGRLAETVAALVLMAKGYRILARNWRCPAGEIDIVAHKGGILVAVEVKRRGSDADAAEAIGARQQARIARALEAFAARHPHLAAHGVRFDAMLVSAGAWPRHVLDAWRP